MMVRMIDVKSDKIILRRLSDDDKITLASLINNKKICDNLKDIVPYPYGVEDAVSFINFTKNENPHSNFAIEYEGKLCGMIGLNRQSDVYRKTAEIGYWIGEPYWNKGIATEAVKLMTDYGFSELNFVRIHTGVFEYNPASMRVLEKNGYKKDGIFEKSVFKNGQLWDEHRYSKINGRYQKEN
jgi:[ribosomal protein S5]-alanine N-acetyltransferase